MIKDIHW